MTPTAYLNLYVYSDSLAFRRLSQSEDLSFTYPFLIRDDIESRHGVRVNLVMRGSGAATINTVKDTMERDSGYFAGGTALSIAVIQCGIVDCAPRPFTYVAVPLLRKIPVAGGRALSWLGRHREALQRIWSYRATSPRTFARQYARLLRLCRASGMQPIAVGLPLPTLEIERRSPGFRRSVARYNELIRDASAGSFCDVEQQFSEETRGRLLLEDGHHLTPEGHRLYADMIVKRVEQILAARREQA